MARGLVFAANPLANCLYRKTPDADEVAATARVWTEPLVSRLSTAWHTVVDMSAVNDAESAPLVNGSISRAAPSGDVHADVRYSMHRDTDDTD